MSNLDPASTFDAELRKSLEALADAARRRDDLLSKPPTPARRRALQVVMEDVRVWMIAAGLASHRLLTAQPRCSLEEEDAALVAWGLVFGDLDSLQFDRVHDALRSIPVGSEAAAADFSGPSLADCELALSFLPTANVALESAPEPREVPAVASGSNDGGAETSKPRTKRGRPSDTDHDEDRRIAEAWESGHHATHSDLATALGMSTRDVKLALDRRAKRMARLAKRNLETDSRQGH